MVFARKQGCRLGPESKINLVSPIFRSVIRYHLWLWFRKCIGDKSATLGKMVILFMAMVVDRSVYIYIMMYKHIQLHIYIYICTDIYITFRNGPYLGQGQTVAPSIKSPSKGLSPKHKSTTPPKTNINTQNSHI